jgi:hypothetical protein
VGVVAPATLGDVDPEPEELELLPTQLVSATGNVCTMFTQFLKPNSRPGLTVNGADWAVAPVESRMVRPRDVPMGQNTIAFSFQM